MIARLIIVARVVVALLAGASLYWLQEYAFYREEDLAAAGPVTVALRDGGTEELPVIGFQAIDSDSSPIRFRSCFTTDLDLAALAARAEPYEGAEPARPPRWFDCFDAVAEGGGIEAGAFQAFLSAREVHPGVDRVVALRADGRLGVAWNQINPCGALVDEDERPARCTNPEGP